MYTFFYAYTAISMLLQCHALFINSKYAVRTTSVVLHSSVKSKEVGDTSTTSAVGYSVGASTVLKCDKLTKSYTGEPQFQGINFNLGKGQRIGLIGLNGAGKSTLLKCLGGVMNADGGSIEISTNTKVVYVDQEPDWGTKKVYEVIFSDKNSLSDGGQCLATRLYMEATKQENEGNEDMLAKALDKMEEFSSWDYQTLGLQIAEKLNIGTNFMYRDVNTLSGGEKKRVGLINALLQQPDVLLLDEPTNHLDADALEWLGDYLKPGGKEKDMAMLLVTHDRYFLERTCSEIVELDRANLHRYPGNYAMYLDMKVARLAAEDADADRARTKLRKESEWMAKQPRARQAKSKARQAQFYDLVGQAKGRADIKKIELNTPEEKEKQRRLGGVVAEFNSAKYVMGSRVLLDDFSYNFRTRDRIGVVGANGVGKSTFLKVLTGTLPLVSGTVRLGETVRIGYYEQTGLALTAEQEKQPVLKFVQEAVEKGAPEKEREKSNAKMVIEEKEVSGRRNIKAGKEGSVNIQLQDSSMSQSQAFSERDAMALLTRFQFPSKRWYDRVGQLSGGERRRLQLLQILAKQPNVLILDEPSNDLDIITLQALEEYITEVFEGCLVIVSHDNFFVNKVTEHLFVFEGDGIVRDFQGSYTDYLDYRRDMADIKREEKLESKKDKALQKGDGSAASGDKNEISTTATAKGAAAKEIPKTLNYNERKEYNKLEKEVSKLTEQVKVIDAKIAASNGSEGYSVLAELTVEASKLRNLLEQKESRWMELSMMD